MRKGFFNPFRGKRGRGWRRRRKFKFPIIGKVKDVNGVLWHVRDIRDTKYGFALYFGTPAKNHVGHRGGRRWLIATKDLQEFWKTNRAQVNGILLDLPAGRSTLKRMRKRLGFNYRDDLTEFWTDRLDDLSTLRPREFAAKHDVNVEVAFDRRFQMIGRTARFPGWWRKPWICRLLLSDLTLGQVGRKLGISNSQVHRLRCRAKADTAAWQLAGLEASPAKCGETL